MFRILTILILAASVIACSGSGSEYVGEWESPNNTKLTFEIVRNGDGFLVIYKNNSKTQDEQIKNEEKIPAILEDGLLQLQGLMSGITFTYIKANDTLMAPFDNKGRTTEFKRKK
jgi:hypothetical protein